MDLINYLIVPPLIKSCSYIQTLACILEFSNNLVTYYVKKKFAFFLKNFMVKHTQLAIFEILNQGIWLQIFEHAFWKDTYIYHLKYTYKGCPKSLAQHTLA